jgi:NADPH-dependent 2,4-dienoyl-CoA reductase/sulfur reductase-like enzyme
MAEHQTDILVIGAGPAGLAAAASAAMTFRGQKVHVLDENRHAGGQIWRADRRKGSPSPAQRFVRSALRGGACFHTGVTVFDAGFAADGRVVVRALDAHGVVSTWTADRCVLATGATERFLPFPGWTLPGVFGVGGLQALVKGGLPVAGERIVIAGSGPLLLAVADSLRKKGARVLGVFEQAPRAALLRFGAGLWRHPAKALQALGLAARLSRTRVMQDAFVVRAHGEDRVSSVTIRVGGREETVETDLLACGFGLVPSFQIASLLGCRIDGDRVVVDELQRTSIEGEISARVLCAGETAGIGGVDAAIAEGRVAGLLAAGQTSLARRAARKARRERRFARELDHAFQLRPELRTLPDPETIVCRCEDVPFGALAAADDLRHAKLQTRCGMGPCQGRVCGPALTFLTGAARDRVRPPLIPVPVSALAASSPGDSTA